MNSRDPDVTFERALGAAVHLSLPWRVDERTYRERIDQTKADILNLLRASGHHRRDFATVRNFLSSLTPHGWVSRVRVSVALNELLLEDLIQISTDENTGLEYISITDKGREQPCT